MSASSTARTSNVAGLENALKTIGFGLADRPFGTPDEEFEVANAAEIELLKAAIANRFEGKTITVTIATMSGDHGRGETIDDVLLYLKVVGKGRGRDAIEHHSVSFRKVRRYWLFGEKEYKLTIHTR